MINPKKHRKMAENVAARMGGSMRYLKKNSTTVLRIVEYTDGDGDQMYAHPFVEHRTTDGQKNLGVCRREMFDLPCAYCRMNDLAKEKGQEIPFKTRTRFMVNAFDAAQAKPKMQVWALPITVNDQISAYVLKEEYADILEDKTGHAFNVEVSGSGLDTEYACTISRRPIEVPANLRKEVVDPVSTVKDPGLEAQCEEIGVDANDIFDDSELEAVKVDKKANKSTKTNTKKTEPKASTSCKVGDRVWVDEFGEDFPGSVTGFKKDGVDVEFDDGDTGNFSVDTVHVIEDEAEPEVDEPEEPTIGNGSRVWVDEFGEEFEGEVYSVLQNGNVCVKFDDGDKKTNIPVTECHLIEGDESAEDESGEEEIAEGDFVICPDDGDGVVYKVTEATDDELTIECDDAVYTVERSACQKTDIPF